MNVASAWVSSWWRCGRTGDSRRNRCYSPRRRQWKSEAHQTSPHKILNRCRLITVLAAIPTHNGWAHDCPLHSILSGAPKGERVTRNRYNSIYSGVGRGNLSPNEAGGVIKADRASAYKGISMRTHMIYTVISALFLLEEEEKYGVPSRTWRFWGKNMAVTSLPCVILEIENRRIGVAMNGFKCAR